ncbi:MAG: hypothetical protein V3V40_05925 [Nitrosomonadaceae bacterium]
MAIISVADCESTSFLVRLEISSSNRFNLCHALEKNHEGRCVSSVIHRVGCQFDKLSDVIYEVPNWLSELAENLPEVEMPPAEGEFITEVIESIYITVGSSVVMLRPTFFTWLGGEIVSSSRQPKLRIELVVDITGEKPEFVWLDNFSLLETDERVLAILNNIPTTVFGFKDVSL